MAQTWREYLEGLVAQAGNAAKLATALHWSDTKISRLRAYQGSFPNGREILALATYSGATAEHVAVLVAQAEARWLAGKEARLAARGTDMPLSPPRKPPVPAGHRLMRTHAMAGAR